MEADRRVSYAVSLVRRFVPRFRLKKKTSSALHRFVGFCFGLFGVKNYMESVWTTLRYTVGVPRIYDRGYGWYAWQTVLHEGWHACQWRTRGPLFAFLYGFPQLLGALALVIAPLLALFVTSAAWWGLLGAVLLAPVPAYWRAKFEREAYMVSTAADYWTWGRMPPNYPEWPVSSFTSPLYYWMWPFRKRETEFFEEWYSALANERWEGYAHVTAGPKFVRYLQECKVLATEFAD